MSSPCALTRFPLLSSLILGILCSWLTILPVDSIAVDAASVPVEPQQTVRNLQASDLPPRFEPAPPFLRQFIYKGLTALQPYLEREGIALGDVSTFVDFEQAELALALTIALSNPQTVQKFDADLSRPNAGEILAKGIEQGIQGFGSLKVTQIQELNSVGAIGNRARGFSFQANFQGLPLQLFGEAVAFRRNGVGALVVLGALNHPLEKIRVQDVAARLDRRFLN